MQELQFFFASEMKFAAFAPVIFYEIQSNLSRYFSKRFRNNLLHFEIYSVNKRFWLARGIKFPSNVLGRKYQLYLDFYIKQFDCFKRP